MSSLFGRQVPRRPWLSFENPGILRNQYRNDPTVMFRCSVYPGRRESAQEKIKPQTLNAVGGGAALTFRFE